MRRLVADSRSARLATLDPDGRPNIVPVVFVVDGSTLYSSVDAKPKRSKQLRRLANVRDRPEGVAVLIDHYDEDWTVVWWIRLRSGIGPTTCSSESIRSMRTCLRSATCWPSTSPNGGDGRGGRYNDRVKALIISADPALREQLKVALGTAGRRGERWEHLEAPNGLVGLKLAWRRISGPSG